MITIIIPTIGRNATFKDAFYSAARCEVSEVAEIIIADNSQEESFSKNLEELRRVDSRVRILSYENRLDMAASWSVAAREASSEWIIYLHDDDILYPAALSRIVPKLDDSYAFVFCNFDILKNNKTRSYKYSVASSNMEKIAINTPKFVSTIISRNYLLQSGSWKMENGFFLDLVGFVEMAALASILHLPEVIGTYRIHEGNASSIANRDKGYGDAFGRALSSIFEKVGDANIRRMILLQMLSCAYPLQGGLARRIAARLLTRFGFAIF
ncbi:MAG TPA: glycosyltransferase [Alphaproteobacteria bacterium]|nr:glycosyltransferase [Alphaproteobacteria bacterium]